jgi:hypothetical protein
MAIGNVIGELVDASTLGELQLRFRQFCAHFGAVRVSQVMLFGDYGAFCAFCVAEFVDARTRDALVRGFGFKEIGPAVYLPLALPSDFERRAAVRAA